MRDANSVITQAVKGITSELAEEYEISEARMYELVGKDCTYPKTKRLIRAIAHCDKSSDKARVRLIKADLDAMFAKLLGEAETPISAAEIHKESSEVVQAILKGEPKAVIKHETREMISAGQRLLGQLDDGISIEEVRTSFEQAG